MQTSDQSYRLAYTDKKPVPAQCRRGDIYYIGNTLPAENGDPKPGRPAVIVSNDHTNAGSDFVTVAYMTTHEARPMPTHVMLDSQITSIVQCERLYTVPKSRLCQYMRHCSDAEMNRVNLGLVHALSIPSTVPVPPVINTDAETESLRQDVAFYRRMNDELLSKLSGKEV